MRIFPIHIIFLLFLGWNVAFGQTTITQNQSQLASSFYRNGEYEKAAPLYLDLYEKSNVQYYFENYINCLVGMKDFDEAEKALKKQLRKLKDPNLQIILGFVYKEMGDNAKAYSLFDEIVENLNPNKGAVISVANQFFNKREFEYAEKSYMKGRQLIPGEMFRSNIATVYAYTRNYPKMMEEYMQMLREDEGSLPGIQGRLNSLLRFDFDQSLRNTVKREVLLGIQQNPGIIVYNRLLIWFFIQDQNYQQALTHAIALDKRTHSEEEEILNFTRSAAQLDQFEIARLGLNYLAGRKPVVKNIVDVKKEMVNVEYRRYISLPKNQREHPGNLVSHFENILNELGYTNQTVSFAIVFSHFLAFHLNETDKANEVLSRALGARELTNQQRSAIQLEQADQMVYNNQLWESTLLYAQIIENNRENPLGDDAKLKKAKLGFYLGDIAWAKAQLDALKASTSKLIANDAMELSLLISSHFELDTVSEPMQLFARGDLLIYRNKDAQALATYDSIGAFYPNHSLSDIILMRKAFLFEKEFDYESALSYYEQLVRNYPWSTSADDALYKIALLYENRFGQSEKAQELYKQIMIEYPSSIYVTDARKRYRILRGDPIETEAFPVDNESEFFRGGGAF
ncbi:MAG TPA: tetratricopeptide repeat protein [Prolixibacteraceae bacterium]|nr:tetratricopeptide repeat protein [Prolixibacteraceae bacterium]